MDIKKERTAPTFEMPAYTLQSLPHKRYIFDVLGVSSAFCLAYVQPERCISCNTLQMLRSPSAGKHIFGLFKPAQDCCQNLYEQTKVISLDASSEYQNQRANHTPRQAADQNLHIADHSLGRWPHHLHVCRIGGQTQEPRGSTRSEKSGHALMTP